MKIHSMVLNLLYADGWTNTVKLIKAFSPVFIVNAPKRINTVVPALFL
jgi:hypothetical protein